MYGYLSLHCHGIITEYTHMPACVHVSSFVSSECNYQCRNTTQNCFGSGFYLEPNFTVLTVSTLPFPRETGASAGSSVGLHMDL